ncbi:hypothetical protein QUC31_002891 [Theobroma cacao]
MCTGGPGSLVGNHRLWQSACFGLCPLKDFGKPPSMSSAAIAGLVLNGLSPNWPLIMGLKDSHWQLGRDRYCSSSEPRDFGNCSTIFNITGDSRN